MRLLLDTNRYRDIVTEVPDVTERFENSSAAWLSLVTIGELRAGFAFGSKKEQNESRLEAVLTLQGVGVLAIDEETTMVYASIYQDLRRKGSMIPTNDMWIAAQAIQHDLTLDTRDKHFDRVANLKLV